MRVQFSESKEARADGGLFRVMPAGGFVQGAKYTITHGKASINLTIDKPLIANASDQFGIGLPDQPKRQVISIATADSCAADIGGVVQTLRYQLPAQYEAYRTSLVYFTEQTNSLSEAQSTQPGWVQFFPWQHMSSMCSKVPFGSSEFGKGKERVYIDCDGNEKSFAIKFFRGRIGFLEMGDQLYQTAQVKVDFSKANTGSCIVEPLFLKAVRNKDAKGMAAQACKFDADSDPIDHQQLLPALRAMQNLLNSEQYDARACAVRSTVALLARIHSAKPKPEKTLPTGEKFKNWLNSALSRPASSDAETVLQGIHRNLKSENHHVNEMAENALTRMVDLLWGAKSTIELPAKEKDRLLQYTLQILGEKLAHTGGLEDDYSTLFKTVAILGPRASPLLPKILALKNKTSMCHFGMADALAAIAPRDPKIFNAVASLLKKDRCLHAVPRLVEIGQDKKTAVLEAMKAALKPNNDIAEEIIRTLESMRADARSTIPLLYQTLRASKRASVRKEALSAIIAIDDNDVNIVNEIALAIENPREYLSDEGVIYNVPRIGFIALLGSLGKKAQPALPALKKVMNTKLTPDEKNALLAVFTNMELPRDQFKSLVVTLNKTTVVD